ncbi:glycerophosphodiester phosphodiesterase family protein [Mucilaginibacter sp. CSA2-8R]|uniref:glycerophosphodiester phosphodiesterase family protein n=1 Tax=Mucilaginibacter sp. CSA2-8R TaxID=3141542 RepID=UPI00315CD6D9
MHNAKNFHTLILLMCLMLGIGNLSRAQSKIILQAHRGGRGLMPENTIPAMKNALDLGADLELDVYLTHDQQLVVSHEDHIPSAIALTPTGDTVSKASESNLSLPLLSYKDIEKYDVGTKFNPAFPQKKSIKVSMPLLTRLIDTAETYAKARHYKLPAYNIEAKLPKGKNLTGGYREALLKAMVALLKEKHIQRRVIIQSFDTEMLEIMHQKYPDFTLSYLVQTGDAEKNLSNLSFKPAYYSPNYHIVHHEDVEFCHQKNIKVIPWTVNTVEEMKVLKSLAVDGLISDYPNLYKLLN